MTDWNVSANVDLVDAHCHLQDGFLRHALEPALVRARAAGVRVLFVAMRVNLCAAPDSP